MRELAAAAKNGLLQSLQSSAAPAILGDVPAAVARYASGVHWLPETDNLLRF